MGLLFSVHGDKFFVLFRAILKYPTRHYQLAIKNGKTIVTSLETIGHWMCHKIVHRLEEILLFINLQQL